MSKSRFLMGIDIGTYSAKGVLVDETGHVHASHTVPYELRIPRPGWAEHDADEDWWASFAEISRALLAGFGAEKPEIAAVCCSTIGPAMLPLDADGRPLRQAILYGIDTRSWQEAEELTEVLGEEAIFESTGKRLSTQANGPKILWFRRHEPELFARTSMVAAATTYVNYKLTGRYAVDTYTAASFNPIFDVETGAWSRAMAAPICDIKLLPEIVETTAVIGHVHREAAASTGLPEGTPVVAGTVDAAAEALSVGVTEPGDAMLMYGTTLFVIHVTDVWRRHPALWSGPYLVPGTYCISAGLATSAALTRWFRDEFGRGEMDLESEGGDNAYASLARLAAGVPAGSNGLIALPYFSGERTPLNDPKARGVIAGLTLSHTKAHVYRALLEGVAYALRHNLETMREADADPRRLVAVGGGTKNAEWLQIISDCLGLPQELPANTIGASYGDAYLAGIGAGMFDGFGTLRDTWVRPDQIIEPRAAEQAVYDDLYPIFRDTYRNLKPQLHQLADRQR